MPTLESLETIANESRARRDQLKTQLNIANIGRTITQHELRIKEELTGEAGGLLVIRDAEGNITEDRRNDYAERLSQAIVDVMANQIFKRQLNLTDEQIEEHRNQIDPVDGRSAFNRILDGYLRQNNFETRCRDTIRGIVQQHEDIIPYEEGVGDGKEKPNVLTHILNHQATQQELNGGLMNGPLLIYNRWFQESLGQDVRTRLEADGLDFANYDHNNEEHTAPFMQYLNTHMGDLTQQLTPDQYLTQYIQYVIIR